MTVMVTILYFARLRETLGKAQEQLELPRGVADVNSLRAHLATRGAAWADALGAPSLRAAVNQDMAVGETPVQAGDEVAFFPPVTGG